MTKYKEELTCLIMGIIFLVMSLERHSARRTNSHVRSIAKVGPQELVFKAVKLQLPYCFFLGKVRR